MQAEPGDDHETRCERSGDGADGVQGVDEAQVGPQRLVAASAGPDRKREDAAQGDRHREQPRRHQRHLSGEDVGEGHVGLGHDARHRRQAPVDAPDRHGRGPHGDRDGGRQSGQRVPGVDGEAAADDCAHCQTDDERRHDQAEGVGGRAEHLGQQPRPHDLEGERQEAGRQHAQRGHPRLRSRCLDDRTGFAGGAAGRGVRPWRGRRHRAGIGHGGEAPSRRGHHDVHRDASPRRSLQASERHQHEAGKEGTDGRPGCIGGVERAGVTRGDGGAGDEPAGHDREGRPHGDGRQRHQHHAHEHPQDGERDTRPTVAVRGAQPRFHRRQPDGQG
jgi:hypothetical protein